MSFALLSDLMLCTFVNRACRCLVISALHSPRRWQRPHRRPQGQHRHVHAAAARQEEAPLQDLPPARAERAVLRGGRARGTERERKRKPEDGFKW